MRLDPFYARAMAIGAWARAQHVVYNWTTDVEPLRAEGARLIERASGSVGDDPTSLTALVDGDDAPPRRCRTGARSSSSGRCSIDPNNAWAWTRRGFLHVYRGDPDEAIAGFERAIRLSPLDPFRFNWLHRHGVRQFRRRAARRMRSNGRTGRFARRSG